MELVTHPPHRVARGVARVVWYESGRAYVELWNAYVCDDEPPCHGWSSVVTDEPTCGSAQWVYTVTVVDDLVVTDAAVGEECPSLEEYVEHVRATVKELRGE